MELTSNERNGFARQAVPYQHQGQLRLAWREFRRHRLAVVSVFVLLILGVVAVVGDAVAPYDPNKINPGLAKGFPQPPSLDHWLGTDALGRDYLSRAIAGARISLSVGFVAVGISILVGVALGATAGHLGGRADDLIMRFTDMFLSLPLFLLIMATTAYLPPSIYSTMVVIGVFGWTSVARLVRGEFLSLKERQFIVAARAVGVPGQRLVLRHLLPNALAPIIVAATLAIPNTILMEAALSFLGLGVPPPQASWGNMLSDAQGWLDYAWWMWVPPGLLISITVLAFNFVGDGLRDALDPTLRR